MVKDVSVNKTVLNIFVFLLIFITMLMSVSAQDYLALQGSAAGAGRGMSGTGTQGNITVEIWSAASGGSLLYNSSSDFWGALNNSRYDILLGNSSQPLSLNFSNTYYLELYINERELDFNGTERQVFQSSVGNITVDDPIKTTKSLNVNDFFNITGVTSAVRTNGTVTIQSVAAPAFTVNNGFNISGASGALSTNGTVTMGSTALIQSTDADDALNVTGGLVIGTNSPGATFKITDLTISDLGVITTRPNPGNTDGYVIINSLNAPALSINSGFNVSGRNGQLSTNSTIGIFTQRATAFTVGSGFNITSADNAVRTNGTVTILNADVDDALNVTGAIFSDEQFKTDGAYVSTAPATSLGLDVSGFMTIANFFNVTPATSAVRTNGTVTILNADTDSAFNVTGGLQVGTGNPGSQLAVGTGGFVISDLGVLTTQSSIGSNGNVIINSLTEPALRINSGFNVSGLNNALRTNGTVTILNTDTDDALNVSGGLKMGAQAGSTFTLASFTISDVGVITTDSAIGPAAGRGNVIINSLTEPALRINSGFNVSGATLAMTTNGTVTIQSRASPALSIQGFNVSGASGALRTNGTVTLITGDQDDAINVSGGGVRVGDSTDFVYVSLVPNTPLFSVKDNFNISAGGVITMGSLAGVKIESTDADDALNVTGSVTSRGAAITIGNAESTTQHRLEVFDGGANKCGYIRLFDETGADWFLFTNTTGQLRINSDAPTTCDLEGAGT